MGVKVLASDFPGFDELSNKFVLCSLTGLSVAGEDNAVDTTVLAGDCDEGLFGLT